MMDNSFGSCHVRGASQGAGLGLAISASGARVHGGTLTLISGSGGSVFRLSLPVQPPAQT